MKAQEFINTLVQFALNKHAVEYNLESKESHFFSFEQKEIKHNAYIAQWYATQLFLVTASNHNRFSDEQLQLMARMYNDAFMNSDFTTYNDPEMKAALLSKMLNQRPKYDALLTSKGARDIISHSFIDDVGVCFATLCNKPDTQGIKRLGSDLFFQCFNKCKNEIGYIEIEI